MAEKYDRLDMIGSGTFGRAWLVRRRTTGKQYVMKEMRVAGLSERDRAQAATEVQALSSCRHVNVIRYREAFLADSHEAGPLLSIVMEYAEAGDLRKKIEDQKGIFFDEQLILDWFVQICFALKYIHGLHILHRDLKTANVFVTADGVLKIGDFGIARILTSTADQASTLIGTPYYLSPEICQRQPYGTQSDMWAIGCILYELCAHDRPFKGSTLSELIMNILHGKYAPLSKQYGPLTEDLIAVLLRSDPGARPTAAQVLAIPAVRPYADAYVRRMRTAAERCVSPATPLSSHVDDARTGNDVTSPSPEPHLVDGAKCSAAEATPQNGISRVTPSRTFVVPSPTPRSPGVDDDERKDDENAKQLATPGESKCNNNEHPRDGSRSTAVRTAARRRPKSCGTPMTFRTHETRRDSVRSERRPAPRKRSSDGGAGGGGRGQGASPRRSIYREAVSRRAADVHTDNSSAFVNRVLRRVRPNSPAAQRLASRRRVVKGGVQDGDQAAVCRTLVSSLYQPTPTGSDGKRRQTADSIRAALLRRFGLMEFSRLRSATRDLVMTSHGGDVARQRRLDAVLASHDAAAVYFPLFFQLVQLEIIAG